MSATKKVTKATKTATKKAPKAATKTATPKAPKAAKKTPKANPDALVSRRNLTRFTYESAAFEGWRLCISRAGTTFTKYFPDKKFGGGKESLAAAEVTLVELKTLIEGAKRVNGKLTATSIKKGEKVLLTAF